MIHVKRAEEIHHKILPIDLHFMGRPNAIATYLIPHSHGAVLVESGPGSTTAVLEKGLAAFGFRPSDITDVLLTHIHLDHAGAAGWLAQQGARVYVHPVGVPHLLDPERLLASARRIYGEMMEPLWGDFLAVPEEQLKVVQDGDLIEVDGLVFRALETLGHANHHFAYFHAGLCFSGDIGGVRMPGIRFLRLPVPPPEFHLELWRESLRKLQKEFLTGSFDRIAPTHFSIFTDAAWHLEELERALSDLSEWIERYLPSEPPIEELNRHFLEWSEARALSRGLDPETIQTYEIANPSWMAAAGIQRYWRKHRANRG